MTENLPRLQLVEFARTNGSKFSLAFNPELTILHGRSATDRTSLLRLIRYAMGRSQKRIDPDYLKQSDKVTLTIIANGQELLFNRSCQHPQGNIEILSDQRVYQGQPRRVASEVLVDTLQLPAMAIDRVSTPDPVSFNDIAQAFVVDRDLGYSGILNELLPAKRKAVLKIMMGLTTAEIADIERDLRDAKRRREELLQRISAVNRFLDDFNVGSLDEIEERRQDIENAIAEIELQETSLNQILAQQITESERDNRYESLSNLLNEKRLEFQENQREISNLRNQEREKEDLSRVLDSEIERLERHLKSRHVISTFTFAHCPRCTQSITSDMRKREIDGDCMLCGREIQTDSFEIASWNKALKDLKQVVKEAQELLENYAARIKQLELSQALISQEINETEYALRKATDEFVAPLAEEIRLLSYERAALEKGLLQLDDENRQRDYLVSLQKETLPQLEQEIESNDIEMKRLQGELGAPRERYAAFTSHFEYFMNSIARVRAFRSSSSDFANFGWSPTDSEPLIDGKSYKDVATGPNLAVSVLAFHYALLAMAVSEPKVTTNHPKLLIIDEPEQQKMPHEWAQKILELFSELAITYQDFIQVIIATRTEDIPERFFEYAVEI